MALGFGRPAWEISSYDDQRTLSVARLSASYRLRAQPTDRQLALWERAAATL